MRARGVWGFAVVAIVLAATACSDDEDTAGPDTTSASVDSGGPAVTTTAAAPATTTPRTSAATTEAPATSSPATTTVTTTVPSTTAPAASWFEPALADRKCPPDYPGNARCVTLTVAADRADPENGTVDLPVTVLEATGPKARPDAIVIPSGGPGYPGFASIGRAGSAWNEEYDLVVYDQRGIGAAVPNLECLAVDAAFVAALQADNDYVHERDAMTTARDQCVAEAEADGIDLADYNSEASAADLDDLRAALGYEQWNLLGISYGARLTLASMRSHPAGIRAVILDSVYDVTYGGVADTVNRVERAFDHLVEGCAADRHCRRAYGDLAAGLDDVRRMYNRNPAEVEADIGNGTERFVINGDDMMAGLFNALYDASLIPLLPAVVDGLRHGDTSALPVFVQSGIPTTTEYADVMALAVNCADNAGLDVGEADAATFEDPGRLGLVVAQTGVCPSNWAATPGDFNAPVESDIPALVLAGGYDPITPPDATEQVAGRLPNSTFLYVEPVGHGVTDFNACITRLELAFLADPTATPDTSCADRIRPPNFQ